MSFSERGSRSTSFVDRTGNVTVLASDLSSNRTAYKFDTECTICLTAAWTIFNPKKYCKFCYRCVCKECSLHRVYHPERVKMERCCNACFSRFISQGVLEDFQKEIGVKDDMLKQATSLLEEEKDRRSIHDATLSGLKAAIAQISEDINTEEENAKDALHSQDEVIAKLENDLSELLAALPSKREQVAKAKARLAKQRAKLAETTIEAKTHREALDELKDLLSSNQDEFARMQRMQETRKVGGTLDSPVKHNRKGKKADLKAVSEELKSQIATLEKENEELEKQIQQLQHSKPPNNSPAREMEHVSALTNNPLLSQYLELQSEVERLKQELDKSPSNASYELIEVEAEQLRRTLLKVQEENEDIIVQMERYKQHSETKRRKRCIIW